MTNRAIRGIVFVVLVHVVGVGCGAGSTVPTAPTIVVQSPRPTFTLSGLVVAETPVGLAPIQGVQVFVAGQRTTTDGNGYYSIPGLIAMSNPVTASKAGYTTDTRSVTISGDTRLDIQIVPLDLGPAYTLWGIVFEGTPGGAVPVEGVQVYCDGCGSPDGHTFAYTDAYGFYKFGWAYGGKTPLLVRKTGYDVLRPEGTFSDGTGTRTVTVNGDTRFDIELVRR